ncbi:hypothetical protein B0H16DRAFT_1699480 [Mycena metata]|uniref:Uncharacterized protein n=1 Tax=Mycena metata TaxID=1033252 RepID=A0AAD7HJ41_9AGAR|nr:hypothetical protein B0H16DRAFT_1699480 [Mycena metata]
MPTFKSLSAALRISKTWYAVFQTHSRSILRAVAENVAGPALPDAVRALRYSVSAKRKEVDQLTKQEYCRLVENAAVVRRLEVAFSLKYRDPLSTASQLNWTESWRFARAVYRIMLYCEVFHISDDEDEFRDLLVQGSRYDEVITQRVAMLNKYPMTELFELDTVLVFLRRIAIEFGGDFIEDEDVFPQDTDALISTGPAAVLHAWEHEDGNSIVETLGYAVWMSRPYALLSDFFAGPLQQIWGDREVSPPSGNAKSLLDEAAYQSPPCDQCGLTSSNKLRCEHDWAGLRLNIRGLFPGNLSQNSTEMELFEESKSWADKHKLISEIYALKTAEYRDWMSSDALCDACLLKFLTAHLHLWLLELKSKDGDVPEDCSDGYWSDVQAEVTLHALTKNGFKKSFRTVKSGLYCHRLHYLGFLV